MMEQDTDDWKKMFCAEQTDNSLWQGDTATVS